MRDMFHKFDLNNDSFAVKADIENGFKEMGFEVDSHMKSEIEKMDTNHDGKVAYKDFIRTHLVQKNII